MSSSSSSSPGGLNPFYLFDGSGAVYLYDHGTMTASLALRIWGPGHGTMSGLAAWGDNGVPSLFCALKKDTDGSSWLLYRDGSGGHIADMKVTADPGWRGLCPWPGSYGTMVAGTDTGISLIETSGGTVSSTEISTSGDIRHMALISGTSSAAEFYLHTVVSGVDEVVTAWVGRDPLSYYGETVAVEAPPPGICGISYPGTEMVTVNEDGNGAVNVVTYVDVILPGARIPVGVLGAVYPVVGGGPLPRDPLEGVSASTMVYDVNGSVKDWGSPVFLATAKPGGVSGVTVVKLKVSGVRGVSNLRLGLVGTDMGSSSVLVGSAGVFDPVTVPSAAFPGINGTEDPDSPLNVTVGVAVAVPVVDNGIVESEWVSLAAGMSSQAIGVFQCRFRWFFDYTPAPVRDITGSSSSSGSSNSSSSSSPP